ncbi:2-aminoethanethiol dioxygenase [Eurytemora carolleeae]|uniref:2-aminoethanethiol dioxygenase n=1 Tax=Eurytemora carolleeae TaxID=1294199 RepID=UPI000C7924B5|nr:2-aminoethanethiol dioxygenase [Eurytemora carolleeae]|eukprot:XP_023336823.1 2-aminoethanethiol dioxygenase-like [Eurytemora affinis]
MCHGIEKVFNLAMGTFSKSENFKQKFEKLLVQTSQLTGKEVGLDKYKSLQAPTNNSSPSRKRRAHAPCTYIKVAENSTISMGVFIVREGERIPLHDHPSMYGIIRCLQGKLKITSFTRKRTDVDVLNSLSSSYKRKIERGELFLAEPLPTLELTPESKPCFLDPVAGNIHQVESVDGPAAFLDILSPPYNTDPDPASADKQIRDCNYYRYLDGDVDGYRWLLLSDPPSSFYCDTELYQGPEFKYSCEEEN